MVIRIGRWDCNYCGHEGNLGPHKHCINCGAIRPEDVKFYLPDDAEVITDEEELKRAKEGPDWVCSNCNSGNLNKASFCNNCGAPKSGKTLEEQTLIGDEVPKDAGKLTREDHVEEYNKKHGLLRRAFNKAKLWFYGALAALMAFLTSFSATVQMEVVQQNWERSIELQENKWVQEAGWSLPAEAQLIKSERAIHHTDKVFRGYETRTRTKQVQVGSEQYACGQKDLGNGYFEEVYCTRPIYESVEETYEEKVYDEVPVYQPYHTYNVQRWKKIEDLKATGTQKPALWPKDQRFDSPQFRPGPRKEAYSITVQRRSKTHEHKSSYDNWERLSKGDKIQAEISTFFRYYKGLKEPLD